MAVSIEWGTKVISIPKADLSVIGGSVYGLDVNAFRLELKALEDDEDGMPFPDTHIHNTEVTLSGVTYARFIEIINGYTVTFEDGQYTVVCSGANHNISDVKNVNQVSLIIGNSAGLIGLGDVQTDIATIQGDIATIQTDVGTIEVDISSLQSDSELLRKLTQNKRTTDPTTGIFTIYDDDDSTPLLTATTYEDVAGSQTYRGQGAERRERLQ